MQGRRTAFSGQALCPARISNYRKKIGYLENTLRDEAKEEGEVVLHLKDHRSVRILRKIYTEEKMETGS